MTFCPRCGKPLHTRTSGAHTRLSCASEDCGFTDYGEQSIATGAVVVRDGSYLLIQRRSPARTWWQIPGGYVEVGESIDDAVIREVLEETGVDSRVISVLGLRHAAGLPPGRPVSNIYVVYHLEAVDGQPRPDGEESFDVGFFGSDEIEQMPDVSAMSLWAIEQTQRSSAFVRQPEREGLHRPGFTLYGTG